jgi:Na+/phosphate symporter
MMKYLDDLNWWKHLAINVGGVLTSILGFLSILNIHYKWLTADSINAFVAIIVAFGTLFVGSFATIVNTYVTERSKKKAKQVAADYEEQKKAEAAAKLEEAKKLVELANQHQAGDSK